MVFASLAVVSLVAEQLGALSNVTPGRQPIHPRCKTTKGIVSDCLYSQILSVAVIVVITVIYKRKFKIVSDIFKNRVGNNCNNCINCKKSNR
jgi:hypothetical protein